MPLNRETILKTFESVNEELSQKGITAECVLIGGSAGIFLSDVVRPTMDIDVFLRTRDNYTDILEIFEDYFIEDVTVASVPDPEEMTISNTYTWSNMIVRIPDFYSLAITKPFTNRAKDEEDLINYILPGIDDFDKLDELIRENKIDYVGNLNDPFLNVNQLEEYKKQMK